MLTQGVNVTDRLKEIGYTDKDLLLAGYDWRLPLQELEARDGYFSQLQSDIEDLYHRNGKRKVALVSHSMGSNTAFYFLQWVTRQIKAGSANWVSTYLHTFVNIGGPMLGTPKAIIGASVGSGAEFAVWGSKVKAGR
jgi:phospholipid:diacylglycerol acyltransferase